MIAGILDYGAGNLHSLAKALEREGLRPRVETDVYAALRADLLVLPGVGAFDTAAERLAPALEEVHARLEAGHAALGICLGMQLLFETSEEGNGRGLGVIPGRVRTLRAKRRPQMGWNEVQFTAEAPEGAPERLHGYYANGYVCECPDEYVLARTGYEGDRFPAAVRKRRTWGFQFHPEKSGAPGLRCLAAVLRQVLAPREATQGGEER